MHIKIRLWVKIVFIIIIVLTFTILYSSYVETKKLETKEYSIVDKNIPKSFYGLKIVQISDIHYKVTTDYDDLKKVINEINLIKPDIVLLTGDLFDKNIKYTEKDYSDLKKLLKSINYNIEKYAIKGEDDLDNSSWENIINDSEFTNLNDAYKLVYYKGNEPLLLMGISSNYKNNHIKNTIDSIYEENKTKYKYSILIIHEPDFIDEIDYSKFNLILAGHSHNGQVILPFIGGIFKDKYSNKYYKEYYDLGKTKLYISSGIGTSEYKFRLFNKPSISLYRLRNK